MITGHHVHLNVAWRTPQFWLIWGVLGLNVTAGIAVIAMASPMLQEVFGGKLLGLDPQTVLSDVQKAAIVAAAAGLVGLISLFNSLGRIFWASTSDYLGRKNTYFVFFTLGPILYALLPTWGHLGLAGLFVASVCVILTMYGGGFATVPAYLADIFGTQMVGAIHGRLITAWSVAGVVGPLLIAKLRETQLASGVPKSLVTLYQESAEEYCPGMSWTVLAAINEIESGDGANEGPSSAGALGPMQFIPSTWAEWGIDGFGQTGTPDIMDPLDAVPSAARLLCAAGAGKTATLSAAIFAYNHATWYVAEVLALASEYAQDYH